MECAVCIRVEVEMEVEMEDDLLVGRVCSHSRGDLSVGQLSLLQSALVSYPVSMGQEVSQRIKCVLQVLN